MQRAAPVRHLAGFGRPLEPLLLEPVQVVLERLARGLGFPRRHGFHRRRVGQPEHAAGLLLAVDDVTQHRQGHRRAGRARDDLPSQHGQPFAIAPSGAADGIAFGIGGARTRLPGAVRAGAQALIGCIIAIALGAAAGPALVGQLPLFAATSIATLALSLALGASLTRAGWFDGATAVWGLAPGGSASMVTLAELNKADPRVTALMQYMRILFARVGHPHCLVCGREIKKLSNEEIIESITSSVAKAKPKKTKEVMGVEINTDTVRIYAPVVVGRKGEYYQLLYDLLNKGYERARVDGKLVSLRERVTLEKHKKHDIDAQGFRE